jgi:hypothetical protein
MSPSDSDRSKSKRENKKKLKYVKPELTVHGAIDKITATMAIGSFMDNTAMMTLSAEP